MTNLIRNTAFTKALERNMGVATLGVSSFRPLFPIEDSMISVLTLPTSTNASVSADPPPPAGLPAGDTNDTLAAFLTIVEQQTHNKKEKVEEETEMTMRRILNQLDCKLLLLHSCYSFLPRPGFPQPHFLPLEQHFQPHQPHPVSSLVQELNLALEELVSASLPNTGPFCLQFASLDMQTRYVLFADNDISTFSIQRKALEIWSNVACMIRGAMQEFGQRRQIRAAEKEPLLLSETSRRSLLIENLGHCLHEATVYMLVGRRLLRFMLDMKQHFDTLASALLSEIACMILELLTEINTCLQCFVVFFCKPQQESILDLYKTLVSVFDCLSPENTARLCKQFFIFSRDVFATRGGMTYFDANQSSSFVHLFLSKFVHVYPRQFNPTVDQVELAIAYAKQFSSQYSFSLDTPMLIFLHKTLGMLYGLMRHFSDAISELTRCTSLQRDMLGPDHIDTLTTIAELAEFQLLSALRPGGDAVSSSDIAGLDAAGRLDELELEPSKRMELEMAKVYLEDAIIRISSQGKPEEGWNALRRQVEKKLDLANQLAKIANKAKE